MHYSKDLYKALEMCKMTYKTALKLRNRNELQFRGMLWRLHISMGLCEHIEFYHPGVYQEYIILYKNLSENPKEHYCEIPSCLKSTKEIRQSFKKRIFLINMMLNEINQQRK